MTFVIKDGKITDPLLDGLMGGSAVTTPRVETAQKIVSVVGAAAITMASAVGIVWTTVGSSGPGIFQVGFSAPSAAAQQQLAVDAGPNGKFGWVTEVSGGMPAGADPVPDAPAAGTAVRIQPNRAPVAAAAAGMSM